MNTSRSRMHLELRELQELCQPLSALRFRRELARMIGHVEALGQAVKDRLEDTRRIFGLTRQPERSLAPHETINRFTAFDNLH